MSRQLMGGQLTRVLPDWSVENGERRQGHLASLPDRARQGRAVVDWLATGFEPAPWSLSNA